MDNHYVIFYDPYAKTIEQIKKYKSEISPQYDNSPLEYRNKLYDYALALWELQPVSDKNIFKTYFNDKCYAEFLLLGLDYYIMRNPFAKSNMSDIIDAIQQIHNKKIEKLSKEVNALMIIYKKMLSNQLPNIDTI